MMNEIRHVPKGNASVLAHFWGVLFIYNGAYQEVCFLTEGGQLNSGSEVDGKREV